MFRFSLQARPHTRRWQMILGFLTVGALIWRVFEAWSNLEFIGQKSGLLWDVTRFLFATQTGANVLLVIFFLLFVLSLLYQLERQNPPVELNPARYGEELTGVPPVETLVKLSAVEQGEFNLQPDNRPFIEYVFTIFNASLQPISILDGASGRARYHSQPLDTEPYIIKNEARNIQYGDSRVFRLRQRLTKEECEQIVRYGTENPDASNHTQLDVTDVIVSAVTNGETAKPFRLRLHDSLKLPFAVPVRLVSSALLEKLEQDATHRHDECDKKITGLQLRARKFEEEATTRAIQVSARESLKLELEKKLAEREAEISSLKSIDVPNDLSVTVQVRFGRLISDNVINFQVQIFNGSPCKITIRSDLVEGEGIKGFILAGKRPLPIKPIIRLIDHFMPPSRFIVLEIEQELSPDDARELDRILNEGTFVHFLFTELDIYMTVEGLSEKVRVPLPAGVDCQKGICSNRMIVGKADWTLPGITNK
jgi:hypothetical protein